MVSLKHMKILVLGASGMLGHRLWIDLSEKGHDVVGCSRRALNQIPLKHELLRSLETSHLRLLIGKLQPEVVLNCIGVIKQSSDLEDYKNTIHINSVLPHVLAGLSKELGFRLIHFSTDCVFSGKTESEYSDFDHHDALDIYGASKSVGEVKDCDSALTLRTSIIGRELFNKTSLIEWFLSQSGKKIKGFSKAVFSGLPTAEVAEVLHKYVFENLDLKGVYNLSVEPIDKWSLLKALNDEFDLKVEIEPESTFEMNRALASNRFKAASGYHPPDWKDLIQKLHIRDEFYKKSFEVN